MKTLYAGIDLHSTNNVVVVTDAEDKVLYRKRLRNELDEVVGELSAFKKKLSGVVVESTYNWYWHVDGLMDEGYRVHLANPGAIQQYSGLKYSDDKSDARWLATLLRLGILPEGYIYPREERPVRDLLRKRGYLVNQRTSNILSIQNLSRISSMARQSLYLGSSGKASSLDAAAALSSETRKSGRCTPPDACQRTRKKGRRNPARSNPGCVQGRTSEQGERTREPLCAPS